MDSFKNFCNFFRNNPDEYDGLMAEKDVMNQVYGMKFKSKEFLAMFYINALINDKVPVKYIVKKLPTEYIPLLKKTLKVRLNPKRIVVEWSKFILCYSDIVKHNKINKIKDNIYPQRNVVQY